jgi:hypothetical protein
MRITKPTPKHLLKILESFLGQHPESRMKKGGQAAHAIFCLLNFLGFAKTPLRHLYPGDVVL